MKFTKRENGGKSIKMLKEKTSLWHDKKIKQF